MEVRPVARTAMGRGDLPEQWAIPLHTMPDALADVAATQREVQGTLGTIGGFLKSQSAAIVALQAAAEEAKAERVAMKSTIEELRSELGEARSQLTKAPGSAELDQRLRERCVKEVAKEVAKSHRAMLTTARAEVDKLGTTQLSQYRASEEATDALRAQLASELAELRAETSALQASLASKAEAEDLEAGMEAQEQRAAGSAEVLAEGLGEARADVERLRGEVLESLGRMADSEAVSKELDDVRMTFARDTSELITSREVESLLERRQESSAIELRNSLEGKADVTAVEYALEDKLDCADAEAILAEMAELRIELGKLEITAVTAAQTAEISTAELGAAIGLERIRLPSNAADDDASCSSPGGDAAASFSWSVSSSVATGRGVPVGSPAATLPRQQQLRGAAAGATPQQHPPLHTYIAAAAVESVPQQAPVMNLFGGGTGAEGLWTWTSGSNSNMHGGGGAHHLSVSRNSKGGKGGRSAAAAVRGEQVFLSAADADCMIWEGGRGGGGGGAMRSGGGGGRGDTIRIGKSGQHAGLYMIAFGYFPKRLAAGAKQQQQQQPHSAAGAAASSGGGSAAAGPREAWTMGGGRDHYSPEGGGGGAARSVGAAAFSVLESAETAPAVNSGSADAGLPGAGVGGGGSGGDDGGGGGGGVIGSGQSCVRVVVDGGAAAMDVHHFSTHTSPSHPATGATKVDFLNLNPGSKIRVSCLGNATDYGSAFLLLRHLG